MDRLIRALALSAGISFALAQPPPSANEVVNLVVRLNHPTEEASPLGAGIVVGLGSDRIYIVTANHVIARQGQAFPEVNVEFKFRPREPVKAKLLQQFVQEKMDLAVLAIQDVAAQKIPLDQWNFTRLGDSGALNNGDAVFAIGHPHGKSWMIAAEPGRFSRRVANSLLFDWAAVVPGHSGGALVNARGELVGMTVNDQQAVSEAIRIEAVVEILRDRGFPVSLARPSDISGEWINDAIDTPYPARMEFKSDGASVFGNVTARGDSAFSMAGTLSDYGIQNGIIEGRTVRFTVRERYQTKPFQFDPTTKTTRPAEYAYYDATYKGDVISHEEIRFIYQGREDYREFTARRIVDLTKKPFTGKTTSESAEYREAYRLAGHKGGVNSLSFVYPSGWLLVSGGREDGLVKTWRVVSAELRRTLYADSRQSLGAVTVSSWWDPEVTITSVLNPAGGDPRFRNWCSIHFDTRLQERNEAEAKAEMFAVPHHGRGVALISAGALGYWIAELRSLKATDLKVALNQPTALAVGAADHGGPELVATVEASGRDGSALILRKTEFGMTSPAGRPNVASHVLWQAPLAHASHKIFLAPNEEAVISADSRTGELTLRATATGNVTVRLSQGLEVGTPAIAIDWKSTVLAHGTDSSNLVRIWELPSGRLLQTINAGGPICALAFTHDAQLLAAGDCKGGAISMWARPPK